MSEGAPVVPASAAGPEPADPGALAARNRRTALGLVIWILALAFAAALVAWLRN